MITLHSAKSSDFTSLGLGALMPDECTVEEIAGGMYQLEMTHPIDDAGRWRQLTSWNIIKSPAPVRETPMIRLNESSITGSTVTRKIYEVRVNSRLRLRTGAGLNYKIIDRYKNGTQVLEMGRDGAWMHVTVLSGGATGWMHTDYLQFLREETETVPGSDTPGKVIEPRSTRDQLFRIVSVDIDDAAGKVYVKALHISYDLAGSLIDGSYAPEGIPAKDVITQIKQKELTQSEFNIYSDVDSKVTGDYGGRSVAECILETDGVIQQTGARLVRDNFDVFVLKDEARDRGAVIRHGKNLTGAVMTVDVSNAVNRIVPVGKGKDGNPLYLSEQRYVDSPRIQAMPVIRAVQISYDVRVGDGDSDFHTDAEARAELKRLAEAEFEKGVDGATIGLEVDFVELEKYEAENPYKSLLQIHLYDSVQVISARSGINAKLRATGYKYDCIKKKYIRVTLGNLQELKTTYSGFDITPGTVSGTKLIENTVDGAMLRDLSVVYGKFQQATINQLNADALSAVTAAIGSITAGSIETDELYAGFAHVIELAADSVKAGNITVDQLAANLAEFIVARAGLVTADTVETDELAAKIAEIIALRAEKITAENIETDHLAAALAEFVALYAKVGTFDFAQAQNLMAGAMLLEHGYADTVNIKNLMVTNANMLSAVIGELVLKSTDGKYYNVSVGTDGALNVEETTVTEGEIAAGQTSGGRGIVETTANIADLAAGTITGEQAVLESILTQALTAGKITAGEALLASASIPTLYVTSMKALGGSIDLSANESITSVVDAASNAQSAADMAMNAADMAVPYYGDTPPDAPIQEGRLWIDSGVQPPMLRRWKGLDMDASRDTAGSATGNPASLPETAVAISEMKVQINANQSGSGTPKPSNIRPLSLTDFIDLYVYAQETGQDSGTVYNAQLPSVCYGGYIDWTRGAYVQTHKYFELKIADMDNGENYPGWKFDRKDLEDCIRPAFNSNVSGARCNISQYVYVNSNSTKWIIFFEKVVIDGLTQSQLKAQYPNLVVQIVLPLIEPVEHPLSLPAIAPLTGQTTLIYSEQASSISASYLISGWETVSDQTLLKTDVEAMRSVIRQLTDEISLSVQKGELETFLRLVSEGVYIGKSDSMYRVFVDDAGVHIQQDGADIAVFAKRTLISPYLRAGDPGAPSVLAWTKTASGGMALVKMEAVV